jgi:hypothetical protein
LRFLLATLLLLAASPLAYASHSESKEYNLTAIGLAGCTDDNGVPFNLNNVCFTIAPGETHVNVTIRDTVMGGKVMAYVYGIVGDFVMYCDQGTPTENSRAFDIHPNATRIQVALVTVINSSRCGGPIAPTHGTVTVAFT